MTKASETAFIESAEQRKIIKDMINRLYLTGFEGTIRRAAVWLGLSYNQTQKRISDLKTDGKLIEIGEIREGGKLNSVYKHSQAEMIRKKPPLRRWLLNKYPEVINEYNSI